MRDFFLATGFCLQVVTFYYICTLKQVEIPKIVQVEIDNSMVAIKPGENSTEPYIMRDNFFYDAGSNDVRTHELMEIFKKYVAEVCPEVKFVDLNAEYEKKWKSLEETKAETENVHP